MNAILPTIFVSHGAPSLLYEPCPARDFLTALGSTMERPRAILCVSAHWTTATPLVSGTAAPALIYDFGGFADELYQATYPAPGAPALAAQIVTLLHDHGIESGINAERGLDHGAWVPLKLMYPQADIPVLQLSVQPQRSPAEHLALGKALRSLRKDGVLILASGSATHNLRDFFGRGINAAPPEYVSAFDAWLQTAILNNDQEALLDYLGKGPHAAANHPTSEHFLPLFAAMGAGETGRTLHRSYTFGVISMAAYAWD
jgi:4,5-DOPA dioxygenase extradiol